MPDPKRIKTTTTHTYNPNLDISCFDKKFQEANLLDEHINVALPSDEEEELDHGGCPTMTKLRATKKAHDNQINNIMARRTRISKMMMIEALGQHIVPTQLRGATAATLCQERPA